MTLIAVMQQNRNASHTKADGKRLIFHSVSTIAVTAEQRSSGV
jgi:hypothetical protein